MLTIPPMASEPFNALLVDDESSFRRALRTSLAASGYAAEEAQNGEQALEILQERSFNLVLLDINMPGLGGVETCREIRAQGLHIGIVMVSVRDAEDDLVQAFEAAPTITLPSLCASVNCSRALGRFRAGYGRRIPSKPVFCESANSSSIWTATCFAGMANLSTSLLRSSICWRF